MARYILTGCLSFDGHSHVIQTANSAGFPDVLGRVSLSLIIEYWWREIGEGSKAVIFITVFTFHMDLFRTSFISFYIFICALAQI